MKDNKLIAEFMDRQKTYKVVHVSNYQGDSVLSVGHDKESAEYDKSHYDERYGIDTEVIEEELKYHSSWDWLMPVVQKIRYAGYTLESTKLAIRVGEVCATANIHLVYENIIKFINWYNK